MSAPSRLHGVAKPTLFTIPTVLLAVFVMPLSTTGTGIALPFIAEDLGSDPTGLQWVVNGFNVAFAVFTLVWGVASDRVGYKATFVIGVALMFAASIVSGIAPTLMVLDLGRVAAGIAGAAVFTGASSILSNVYEGAARARAFALFGTVVGLAVALGPTIAGVLVGWLGWHGVYAAFATFALLALIGSVTIAPVRSERVAGQKVIDFSLLRNTRFMTFALVPVVGAVGFVTFASYLPVALRAVAGLSATQAGLFMLWMTLPVLVTPLVGARLVSGIAAISSMTVVYISLVCLALGDLGIVLLAPGHSVALVVGPMVLLGIGYGLPLGLIDSEALSAVPARSSGTAAGVLNFLRLGSEAIAVGAYAAVVATLLLTSIGDPATANKAAAGQPGHAGEYAQSLHDVAPALAIVVFVIALVIVTLHRASISRTHGRPGDAAVLGSPIAPIRGVSETQNKD